jgi:FMN phosphatase YigB (HAD superfamily)
MKYKLIISDFDGVICSDFYYSNLSSTAPEVFDFINRKLFKENPVMIDDWMRGLLSYKDINKWLKKEDPSIKIDLDKILLEGITQMRLDENYLSELSRLRKIGIKVILATNNMDIFSLKMIPEKKLDKYFDGIFCSSDHGLLKHEQNAKFYRDILALYDIDDHRDALLIDDSVKATQAFSKIGGDFYLYKELRDFKKFISALN